MKRLIDRLTLILLLLLAGKGGVAAQDTLTYSASLITTMGSGNFAPYYLTANRHGLVSQSANAILDVKAVKPLNTDRRFSWGGGVELAAGWNEPTVYQYYNSAETSWNDHDLYGRRAQIQQLYAEVKYRSVYLSAGMRHHESPLLDSSLSSGDLTESGNSAPLPEVRAGFIDFRDIPFTNGWVQIEGAVSYGIFTDYGWLKRHFNYYNGHITSGSLMSYRRCFFRTKPSKPFSVTVGMQLATVFGGKMLKYRQGELVETRHFGKRLTDFLEAFMPISSKEDFRLGNSLGSWNLKARYRLRNGANISAYFQGPFDDGSGIGRRNGFDGLWGISYHAPHRGWVDAAVIEYLDFTNQSGPLHWAPGDRPGTSLTGFATGGDDYYNNAYYNAYANYGQAIGTPFVKSPLFNTDGYLEFIANRMRGFHAAVSGSPITGLQYRAMVSYRKAWGNGKIFLPQALHSTSVMVEAAYDIPRVNGLNVKAAFALDNGSLFDNHSGIELTFSYTGNFSFNHK